MNGNQRADRFAVPVKQFDESRLIRAAESEPIKACDFCQVRFLRGAYLKHDAPFYLTANPAI